MLYPAASADIHAMVVRCVDQSLQGGPAHHAECAARKLEAIHGMAHLRMAGEVGRAQQRRPHARGAAPTPSSSSFRYVGVSTE
jgi:hypothetical protein